MDNLLELAATHGRAIASHEDVLEWASSDDTIGQSAQSFLSTYERVPVWVDNEQLDRGKRVYLAYLPAISISLYYRSLVPGFSIPKIATVLSMTGYLAPPSTREQVENRLMDTGAFLCAAMTEDVLPGGIGWRTALQVRILHAKVRRRLLSSQKWDASELGVPINQEDMAATLLAFSVNSLLGIEILLGQPIPMQERTDYLALWRYLGWLLGIHVNDIRNADEILPRPLDPCGPGWHSISATSSWEHSCAIFQSIILHILHPNDLSRHISHHLLMIGRPREVKTKKATSLPPGHDNWFYFRCLQCRQHIGDPLADALQLPFHPTAWGRRRMRLFSGIYTAIMTCYTIMGLPWSPLRCFVVWWHRRALQGFFRQLQTTHLGRMRQQFGTSCACSFSMVQPPSQ